MHGNWRTSEGRPCTDFWEDTLPAIAGAVFIIMIVVSGIDALVQALT